MGQFMRTSAAGDPLHECPSVPAGLMAGIHWRLYFALVVVIGDNAWYSFAASNGQFNRLPAFDAP